MTPAQVLTVIRDHTPIRQGELRACTCTPTLGFRMSPAEHTAHLAERIAAASTDRPATADGLLTAAELADHPDPHRGRTVVVPVMGIGDVTGTLTAARRTHRPHPLVEIDLAHPDRPATTRVVRPDTWISLHP